MKTKCNCGKELESKFSEKEKLHYFFCDKCKRGGKGKTEKSALSEFEKLSAENLPAVPNRKNFLPWIKSHENEILSHAAGFIEKPALAKMLKKNVDYVMTADLKKAWETDEGVKSIVSALTESMYYGATIGQTGSIVPFGGVVEFIPAVECFQSALTTGKNPPCKKIVIECLHENDQYEISTKNGDFSYEMKKITFPRGDVVGVVVLAEKSDGKIFGNAYDVDRLMQKAEQHSVSYKYYLQDMHALKKAQSTGKDFIEKWGRKLYEHDITNPYANADKPEMLKKLAGKSFLNPLFKEKRINEVLGELNPDETSQDFNPSAIVQNSIESITDAEIIEEVEENENYKNVDSNIDANIFD